MFTVVQTLDRAESFRRDTRRRAVEAGRGEASALVSLGVVVLVGLDDADVAARSLALR